ncbi:MAG TPA: hypothetical protein VMN60_04920 [Longimicrobiales bacterium]|nr:hypothetical protein [Longimicrobiales bacterium]
MWLEIREHQGGVHSTIGPLQGHELYEGLSVPLGHRFFVTAVGDDLFVGSGLTADLDKHTVAQGEVRRLQLPILRFAVTD